MPDPVRFEITLGRASELAACAAAGLPVVEELGERTSRAILSAAAAMYLRPHCLYLIAKEEGGAVVGGLLAQKRGVNLVGREDVFVDVLAVRPDRRGMGIGVKLRERAEEWAREEGAAHIVLTLPETSPMTPPESYKLAESWYRKEL